MLTLAFISSNTLAEWTIPGNRCIASIQLNYMTGQAAYSQTSVANAKHRTTASNTNPLSIVCSTPIIKSYGSNLDMDFAIENNSSDKDISCKGYLYDAEDKIVQITTTVSAGKGRATLKAYPDTKYRNTEPVTVRAICTIPDRGLLGKDAASKLFSVRVY